VYGLQCRQVPDEGRWRHRGRVVHERELAFHHGSCAYVLLDFVLGTDRDLCYVCSALADGSQVVERQCARLAVQASIFQMLQGAQRQRHVQQ
jgi:hypothetical protein